VTQIGKLCLLCLGVDAINVALFALAILLPKASADDSGSKPGHLLLAGGGAVLIAFAFLKGLNPLYGVNEEVLNDQLGNILATPPVKVEIPADAPSIGKPDAPVTIVKFSDFECPACKLGAKSIHPLFKRFSKEVRFVFLNFPLAPECNADPALKRSIHPFACEAAAVAVCASRQGKYAEAYEALFEHQSSFEHGKIAALVASNVPGIDLAKLEECRTLPSTAEAIRRDTMIGMALKVRSTPTFFLNGRRIEGGIPTKIWVDAIEKVMSL
jgi:protein-disulfide isomerase